MMTYSLMMPFALAMAVIVNFAHAKEIGVNIQLKNLYADRDYDDPTKPSIGSWTQGIIARAEAQHALDDNISLHFTGSLQYAKRLSADKNINDMILPFDAVKNEQADAYHKVAGSVGLQHQNHKLSWGEQWVDTPLATTDYSRQLITIYQGWLYTGELNHSLKVDIGYLDQYSPRSEENFRKLSVSNQESDGLIYVDLKHKSLDNKLHTQVFLSELEDLYHQYSLGIQYKTQYDKLKLATKFRYYYTEESGAERLGEIDNQYYGVMQEISDHRNTFSVGVQKLHGESHFPTLDGAVPVLGYVNWSQGAFNKANELSYHFNFNHDASWILPGLNILVRYIDGQDYVMNGVKGNKESELDFITTYKVNKGKFKGLGFQWLNLNYKNSNHADYMENRFFTTYSKRF